MFFETDKKMLRKVHRLQNHAQTQCNCSVDHSQGERDSQLSFKHLQPRDIYMTCDRLWVQKITCSFPCFSRVLHHHWFGLQFYKLPCWCRSFPDRCCRCLSASFSCTICGSLLPELFCTRLEANSFLECLEEQKDLCLWLQQVNNIWKQIRFSLSLLADFIHQSKGQTSCTESAWHWQHCFVTCTFWFGTIWETCFRWFNVFFLVFLLSCRFCSTRHWQFCCEKWAFLIWAWEEKTKHTCQIQC